jgi:hypothetical protein
MNIEELTSKFTREEYIRKCSESTQTYLCPRKFGLKDNFPKCSEDIEKCKECVITATKDIKFKGEEVVEGEKVEEVIKVRCIKNEKLKLYLTIDIEYKVIAVNRDGYHIEDDAGNEECYLKEYFEKVTDDVLMVECIKDSKPLGITLGKRYKLTKEDEKYCIINDFGYEAKYNKNCFKPVEPQKEVKEMDFKTVIADIKPNEEYICQDNYIVRCYENRKIEFEAPSGNKIWFDKEDRFEKIEPKPVTTTEAFKALDEGKIIESVKSNCKYKKEERGLLIQIENTFLKCGSMSSSELEGQWIILE